MKHTINKLNKILLETPRKNPNDNERHSLIYEPRYFGYSNYLGRKVALWFTKAMSEKVSKDRED